jgi:hypothetical protein
MRAWKGFRVAAVAALLSGLVAALLLLGPGMPAGAMIISGGGGTCTRSWSAGVDGSWTDGTKWTPAGVPGASDDVCITVGGTYTVTLTGAQSVNSLTVGGGSGQATLAMEGDFDIGGAWLTAAGTVDNAGVIRLDSFYGQDTGITAGGTLTNTGTIQVGSESGFKALRGNVDNQGTIQVDDNLDLDNGGSFQTSGTVNLAAGAQMTLSNDYVQTAGTTNIASTASLTVPGANQVDIQGGVLSGNGTAGPDVVNAGEVRPGSSPGILTVSGDYTQTGTLTIEIAGTTPGTGYDQLAVSGTATIGGELAVTTTGFVPMGTDVFQVLTATSVSGTFSTLTFTGPAYDVTYNADNVSLMLADDSVPPVITITAPEDGATYTQGDAVLADYSCDDGNGWGVETCIGDVADGDAIDTSAPGIFTFAVETTDYAGDWDYLEVTYNVEAPATPTPTPTPEPPTPTPTATPEPPTPTPTPAPTTPPAGEPWTVTAEASDSNPAPGSDVEITGSVLDGNGDPVAGVQVTFTITSNPGGANFGGADSTQATTDANGRATAVLSAGAQPGTIVILVEAGSVAAQVSVTTSGPQSLPKTGGVRSSGDGSFLFLGAAALMGVALAACYAAASRARHTRA